MSLKGAAAMPATAVLPSDRQRLFVYYFTATLTDLVVLGLFDEWSDKVAVDGFSIMLLAALLLQLLLKVTIHLEHKVLHYFEGRSGGMWTFAKYFCAWLILFGSKFVILEALVLTFGDRVHFGGPWHGVIWLIIVVMTMLVAEELVLRLYRRLA
jgi:hypothetical protein